MSTITPLTVIQGRYLAPLDEVDAHREAHLAFVDGPRRGRPRSLMAGRRTPPDGSILVFRGDDARRRARAARGRPVRRRRASSRTTLVGVFTPGRARARAAAALLTAADQTRRDPARRAAAPRPAAASSSTPTPTRGSVGDLDAAERGDRRRGWTAASRPARPATASARRRAPAARPRAPTRSSAACG